MTALAARLSAEGESVAVRNLDFDYISLLQFLSRSYRHKAVSALPDQIIQYRAQYPHAKFVFAGHSNGTCILGEAMQNSPRMNFDRLYLGGSALPGRSTGRN